MECEHKSLENIHCFKCDKTCLEILAEAKRDMREVTCDARETYEDMKEQLEDANEIIASILVLDINQAKEWAEDYLKKHPIK